MVPMGYHMISLLERQKTTYLTVGTHLEVSSETLTHQLLSRSFYDYSSHIQRIVEGVAKQELWALPVLRLDKAEHYCCQGLYDDGIFINEDRASRKARKYS